MVDRRKFRSQTSDNVERWKSRGGKSQRGDEKKWEDQRGEKLRRKKMQAREKVGKSRLTAFFQWFVAPEGRKVTSLFMGFLYTIIDQHSHNWGRHHALGMPGFLGCSPTHSRPLSPRSRGGGPRWWLWYVPSCLCMEYPHFYMGWNMDIIWD